MTGQTRFTRSDRLWSGWPTAVEAARAEHQAWHEAFLDHIRPGRRCCDVQTCERAHYLDQQADAAGKRLEIAKDAARVAARSAVRP